jgi:hypothetical protein
VQQLPDDRGTSKAKEKRGSQIKSKPRISNVTGSDTSRSSTETPPVSDGEQVPIRYASIPLSQILHPQTNDYKSEWSTQYPDATKPQVSDDAGQDGDTLGDDEEVEEIPVRQPLKFMDPGFREPMHKTTIIGSPRTVGGIVEMLNSFNEFPVKTSLRNAELFTFCKYSYAVTIPPAHINNKDHQYVAPRLCSVDGGGFHPLFAKEILPWQIQSPLMPNVAILMSSATQGYLRDPTSEMSSETLVIRSHVLQLVNRFIRQDFALVAHQAMRIVIHLVIIEVITVKY